MKLKRVRIAVELKEEGKRKRLVTSATIHKHLTIITDQRHLRA